MTSPLLEVVGLHKRYGSTVALREVSFSVHQGEVFGLLGPNGAGKTTLLSILSGLLDATSGEVRLLGRRVTPGDSEARRFIGIVPQDLALYANLTARENLDFFGELYGLGGATLKQRVEDILAAIGLADRADHRAVTFSGGMKRRLNLGIALVHGPRLLLLDEPTVGVDPQSRAHIFDEVRRRNAEGLTIVYTSHYMEEVQTLCKRVGIIDQGQLVACDSLDALLHQMPGLVRVRLGQDRPLPLARLEALPDCTVRPGREGAVELDCHDVKGTLIRLIGLLNEENIELVHLETEEPNLERVFLHLTGRALRD